MNTAVSRNAVEQYVSAVRAELDDLTAEEIEELTGGLEADLADALASEGEDDPARRFGTPAAYAAELRSAAGLAPRAVSGGGRRGVRNRVEEWHASLGRQPWWDPMTAYLVSLRPAWWLVRAVAVAAAAAMVTGMVGLGFVLLLVLLAVSVPAGRRAWQRRGPGPQLGIALFNVVAVLALVIGFCAVFFGGGRSSSGSADEYAYPSDSLDSTGVTAPDGYAVTNIFPYDRDGNPLDDVQLYDDRGRPLNAQQGYTDHEGRKVDYVPGVDGNGQQRWNAYPLRERGPYDEYATDPYTGEPVTVPTGPPHDAARPDPSVAPLAVLPTTIPGASTTPTPTPTPTPSATEESGKND